MSETVFILDFGSQYTQLIARAVREANVYCEIIPYNKPIAFDSNHKNKVGVESVLKGIILSGSPCSVNEDDAPAVDLAALLERAPVLGICYGAQYTAKYFGGCVGKSSKREYGRAKLLLSSNSAGGKKRGTSLLCDPLLKGISKKTQVWMSHSDSIQALPAGFDVLAHTDSIPIAAFKKSDNAQVTGTTITPITDSDVGTSGRKRSRSAGEHHNALYGLQFHPEVYHTTEGKKIIANFLTHICGCNPIWTPASFVEESVASLRATIGPEKHVIMALSGGVDSTVAATLISQAVGSRLHCIFVDNCLLRKGEFAAVLKAYSTLGLNVQGVDAKERFFEKLKGVTDPETKRKIIGGLFIEVFQEEAKKVQNAAFLGQGTIYPDVVESASVHGGPSVTIKSHHNVGGLPETMHLTLVEPLRFLFKDEVRRVGITLGIPAEIINRHPFPGPGLGIRILGDVTPEKVALLQEADHCFIEGLKRAKLYDKVWQAGAVLLPVKSVGVMGDERTYESTVALRAVTSVDGMTADWAHLPYEFLASISNEIINNVKGINRVVYDISSKPPATIEWE